jgi:hypothetical protein
MQFPLPVVSKRTFMRETVTLDGTRFENCRFIECHIVYSGGPAETSVCEFSPNTVWDFQGAAATTMVVLQQCGWHFEYGKGDLPIPLPRA